MTCGKHYFIFYFTSDYKSKATTTILIISFLLFRLLKKGVTLNRDTEIAKVQIIADYFHGQFTVWASYYTGAFIIVIVFLATLFFEGKLNWSYYTAGAVFSLLIFGFLFASAKRNYDASLDGVQKMIGLVEKGEPLPALPELKKWKGKKPQYLFKSKSLLILISIVLLLIASFISGYIWAYNSAQDEGRTLIIEKIAHHESVVLNLSSANVLTQLRGMFPKKLNYTDLLLWGSTKLTYTKEPIENRTTNPIEILNRGVGRCGEFSIVYVSICLANNIPARLVIDAVVDHVWAEVNPSEDNKAWIHVDPTQSMVNKKPIVNDPLMYVRDWHSGLKMVLAFQIAAESQVLIIDRTSYYVNL